MHRSRRGSHCQDHQCLSDTGFLRHQSMYSASSFGRDLKMPEDHRSVIGLDLLRGLAAIEVFVGHVRDHSFVAYAALPADQHSPFMAAFFALTRMGREAVLVFFALSGFLVFGQVIRRLREGRFDLGTYCIDRTTRIFLPLVPACIISVLLGWLVFHTPVDSAQLLFNVVGLNGVLADTLHMNAPLWTLSYEIWFYVVAGAIGY